MLRKHSTLVFSACALVVWSIGLTAPARSAFASVTPDTTPAEGFTNALSVSMGPDNTACAVLSSGLIYCWGADGQGQLGDGTSSTTGSDSAVQVDGVTDAVSVSNDLNGTFCALLSSGGVDCWGWNANGELGIGDNSGPDTCSDGYPCSETAVPVCAAGEVAPCAADLSGVVSLSSPYDAFCAVLSSGAVDCWGDGNYGDLGAGDGDPDGLEVSPTPMCTGTSDTCSAPLTNVAALYSDGFDDQCAVLDSGGVDCSGDNDYGEVGDGTTDEADVATPVTGLSGVVSLTQQVVHAYCAVLTNGNVECWGLNSDGQLGDGTHTGPQKCGGQPCSTVPVEATGVSEATAVTGSTGVFNGAYNVCATLSTGAADCWGENGGGELGDGSTKNHFKPVMVTGISTVTSLSSDGSGYCALLSSKAAECWGAGTIGELGNGAQNNSDVPVQVSGLTNIANMAEPGYDDYCAVLTSGAVDCWGNNQGGQLGDGSFDSDSDRPVPVILAGQSLPPRITGFSPTSGAPGVTVTIKGANLSGATSVTFNGVSASISKDTATNIKAVVPAGATSGKIKITTPGGSVKTSRTFTVT